MMKACNKRPVDPNNVEQVINELEHEWASNKKGITSKRIGKDILRKLRDIDDIAYLRFASVYIHFEDAKHFVDFIQSEFD